MAFQRLFLGVFAATALVAPAFAQLKAVEPFYAVTTERASLRCGEGEFFYKVGDVVPGVTLTVDGESGPWSRVAYPANLSAYAKSDEVEIQGNTAKLTKPSKLWAVNAAAGFGSSWKALLPSPLPANTTLKVIEPVKEKNDGPIVGYRIAPPEQARAYVETRVLKKTDQAPSAAPATPTSPTTPPAAVPTPAAPTTTPTAPPVDLTDPMVKPGETPPVTIDQTPGTNPVVPPTDPAAAPITPAQPVPAPREVSDWITLDRTFKSVWRQPLLEAELDELVAEHERALEKVDPNDERLHQQIQRRIDALQLRIDLRTTLREQAEAKAALNRTKDEVAEQLAIAERARVYTIVGQLQPSTVYDGQKLPLMYRIVSVGAASPRTLGYLKDNPQFQLKGKIGAVLGVIGDAELDRSLMLNIITPIRVDTLRPAGETSGFNVPAAPTPTPTTATVPETPANDR